MADADDISWYVQFGSSLLASPLYSFGLYRGNRMLWRVAVPMVSYMLHTCHAHVHVHVLSAAWLALARLLRFLCYFASTASRCGGWLPMIFGGGLAWLAC